MVKLVENGLNISTTKREKKPTTARDIFLLMVIISIILFNSSPTQLNIILLFSVTLPIALTSTKG